MGGWAGTARVAVVNVGLWYDGSEKLDFHFREHSFLDNPRTPREVKRSKGTITFCGLDKFQPGQVRSRFRLHVLQGY
jgi:hypothetical protein